MVGEVKANCEKNNDELAFDNFGVHSLYSCTIEAYRQIGCKLYYFKHTDKYEFMRHHFPRILLSMAILIALMIFGCTGSDKTEAEPQTTDSSLTSAASSVPKVPPWEDPKYAAWKRAEFENVIVYYPPGHIHEAQMPQAAKDYKNAITKISGTAQLPVPTDTVRVMYYTGPGQAYEMTGRDFPFGDSLAVHYWPNYSRGPSLLQRLFYSYFGGWSGQRIMHHGLIALFDFAGENHHQTTLEYLRDTFFIPLARLQSDTLMNSDVERYQTAEAGSLVAFILATRGITSIEALYRSTLPFDQAVQQTLGISIDSLQKEWVEFVQLNTEPVDTTQVKAGQ